MTDSNDELFENVYLNSGLVCRDPIAQEGLVDSVSEAHVPEKIVNRYEVRPEKIRCAVCSTDKKHNFGVTIKYTNGDLALSGLTCAANKFGEDSISRLRKNFETRQRNVVLKELVEPAILACESAIIALESQWLPIESALTIFLSRTTPEIWRTVSRIRAGEPTTYPSILLGELDGEDRFSRARTICKSEGIGASKEYFLKDAAFLTLENDLAKCLRKLKRLLERLKSKPSTNADLSKLNRTRLEISNEIAENISNILKFRGFLEDDNLICYAAFLTLHSSNYFYSFSKNTKSILKIDEYWAGTKVSYRVPDLKSIANFKRPDELLKVRLR